MICTCQSFKCLLDLNICKFTRVFISNCNRDGLILCHSNITIIAYTRIHIVVREGIWCFILFGYGITTNHYIIDRNRIIFAGVYTNRYFRIIQLTKGIQILTITVLNNKLILMALSASRHFTGDDFDQLQITANSLIFVGNRTVGILILFDLYRCTDLFRPLIPINSWVVPTFSGCKLDHRIIAIS